MPCDIAVQTVGPCGLRMAHPSKSRGGYCYSNEKQKQEKWVKSGWRSYTHSTHYSIEVLPQGTEEHWLSKDCVTQYQALLLESCLEKPLPPILLPSCPMPTGKCSFVTVMKWTMKPGYVRAVVPQLKWAEEVNPIQALWQGRGKYIYHILCFYYWGQETKTKGCPWPS